MSDIILLHSSVRIIVKENIKKNNCFYIYCNMLYMNCMCNEINMCCTFEWFSFYAKA